MPIRSNAQKLSVLVLLLLATSSPASACICTQAPTVENSLTNFPVAIKVQVGADISPAPSCPPGTFCPGIMFRNQYLDSVVDVSFKSGTTGGTSGKLIVKNRGFCGAGLQEHSDMLLFGTIRDEAVEGYFGTIPVFTPSPCADNQQWAALSEEDQTTIVEYQDTT